MALIRSHERGWISAHERPDGPAVYWSQRGGPIVAPCNTGWMILYRDGNTSEGYATADDAKAEVERRWLKLSEP